MVKDGEDYHGLRTTNLKKFNFQDTQNVTRLLYILKSRQKRMLASQSRSTMKLKVLFLKFADFL